MSNDLDEQGSGGGRTKACPVCRAENDPEATQCSGCGNTFGDEATLPAVNNGDVECPHCGAVLSPGSVTCVVCGEAVDVVQPSDMVSRELENGVTDNGEAYVVCPGCGAELPADAASCFICGEMFAQEGAGEIPAAGDIPAEAEGAPEEPVDDDWDMGVVGGDEVPHSEEEYEEPPAAEAEAPEEAYEEPPEEIPDEDDLEVPEEVPEEPEEPAEEMPELGPNEFACPSCGMAVTVGSSRCSNCWVELPDMIRCPKCDVIIPLDSTTCPDCFSRLEAGILIDEPAELEAEAPLEAEAEISDEEISEEPEEDLMPDEEEYEEETIEEISEVYGVECPFCNAVVHAGEDICPECGMPLIEQDAAPEPEKPAVKTYDKPERDWYKIIAFILVIVLLVSAIVPFAIPLPQVDRERVRIDGSFDDWQPVTYHNDTTDAPLNPNVDIIDYRLITDAFNVYFYVQVAGNIFGDADGDTARIFIDVDQDESTGYSIMGTGADYQIRVFGHQGEVESSSCLVFDNTRAQNDFNGFTSHCPSVPHTGETAEDSDKFEVRADLADLGMLRDQSITVVYYMGNSAGEHDFSDAPIANIGTVLIVQQTSIVPATGLITPSNSAVLSLQLSVAGGQTNVTAVNIPGCTIAGTYNGISGNQTTQLTVSRTTSGLTNGDFVNVEAEPGHFTADDADIVVMGQGAYAYYNAAPGIIRIDGAFADWNGKGTAVIDNADDAMAKNNMDAFDDPALDIQEQRTAVENNNLNILVQAAPGGEILAGMWVPEIEEEYVDTTSTTRSESAEQQNDNPYSYTEPVVQDGTRNPDITRPTTKLEKTGEGCIRVYLDTDNDETTGYMIYGLGANGDENIGADMLVEIFGQESKVTRTQFSAFSGTDQNMQDWTVDTGVTPQGASSGNMVEIAVPTSVFGSAASNNATAVIQLVDWNMNGDMSDLTSWDVFDVTRRKSGTRDGELHSLGGHVTTDGVSLSGDSTVIAKNMIHNRYTVNQSYIPTNPLAKNYKVSLGIAGSAEGDPISLYATNGTYYGINVTTYPGEFSFKESDIELTTPLPPTAPHDLVASNLGPVNGTWGIQLDWTNTAAPDDQYIFSTDSELAENGNTNSGRYYGTRLTAFYNDNGSLTSYTDTNPVFNKTNYYYIESVDSSNNCNYSIEVSALADFWPPTMNHVNITDYYAALIPINVLLADGVGIEYSTVYYRKLGAPSWDSRAMEMIAGSINAGNWRAWMPVDYSFGPTQYEYYIETSDGTYTTFWGDPGNTLLLNASAPPTDPYPIYGRVKWPDGSWVGPGADVYVEWLNVTGSIVNDPAWWPFTTVGESQYSVDILDYDSNTVIWANGTYAGLWGFNQTMAIIPTMGGEEVDIILENPIINITKSAPTTAAPGQTIMYTVTVTNTGNSTAYNVNVTETYDPWVTYVDSNPVPSFGNNVWIFPTIAPGVTEVIYINVTINATTSFGTNVINLVTANYTYSVGIFLPEASDTAVTLIGGATLNLTKTAPAWANTGETITYWLTYSNTGNLWATNIVITEVYPLEVTFIDSIPPPSVGNNIWMAPEIPAVLGPGASGSIQITVQVDANAVGPLFNWANITGFDQLGFPLTPAEANATTLIRDPLVTVTKSGPATANTGETIMYMIDYLNTGTDTAYNVIITDNYPAGVTFVDANPAPTIPDNVWIIPVLPAGAGGTIYINVTVDTIGGNITNYVYLEYEDANGEDQPIAEDWLNTTIGNPWMTIIKTGPAQANNGETIMYMIRYENVGDDWAYNVWVNDTIPAGTTFVDSNPFPPDVVAPPLYGWDIGNVAPGTIGYVYINVTVNNGTVGTITNWAYLEYEDDAGQSAMPISDRADTDIVNPLVTIQKWAPPTANTGEFITYWLNYSNTGTAPAYNIVITETYPAGVIFISAIPPPSAGNNVWDGSTVPSLAMLPPGASGSIQINVQVIVSSGILINNVTLTYNNSAQAQPVVNASAITVVNNPLIIISKTGPALANPGDTITYTITYQNIGPDTAYNVIITEFYPFEVTFVSAIPPPDLLDNIWIIPTLAPGAGGIITITVQVAQGAAGWITNLVGADYENSAGQAQPTVWDWHDTYINITEPELLIIKDGPVNATAGQNITYTITIDNIGTDTAYDIWVNETYPANVTFVSAFPPPTSGNGTWYFANLTNGSSITIIINVTINGNVTGWLTNFVTVEYRNRDDISMPTETAWWSTFISGPWMLMDKTGPMTVNPGGTITYSIYYINNGTGTARNVTITESYPAGVTFVLAVPPPDIGNDTWLIGDLLPGEDGWINITVLVNASVAIGTSLVNFAFLNYSDNASQSMPTVIDDAWTWVANPGMIITKTGPATAVFGETITYTITYTNLGSDWAYNVVITEAYPAGVSFVSSVPAPDFGNNVWIIPAVAPFGGTGTILVTVNVTATTGTILNFVNMTYENGAGVNYGPLSDTWLTTIIGPLVTVTKDAPAQASPGQTIVYTITVVNNGNDWAYNVTVTETYPPGVTFVSAIPMPDIGNNIWIIPFLAPFGGTAIIQITVMIDPTASGTVTNWANVTYNNSASIQAIAGDYANVTIVDSQVSITKWAPATANTGQQITYWLNYTNTGSDWAYNVFITETYPVGVTFVSAVPVPDIGNNVWLIGDVAPGGSGSIEITVQVNNGVANGTLLVNNATVVGENGGGMIFQDWAEANTLVLDPIMIISKIANPVGTQPGEVIQYMITYQNNGGDTAYNVIITETYPPEVTFLDANPWPDVFPDTWFIGDLLPGQGGTIFINVTVSPTASGPILNRVDLEYWNTVRQMPTVWDTALNFISGPNLEITKTAPAQAIAGQNIIYTITVTNTGPGTAFNVWVNDTLPTEVTFVSSSIPPTIPGPPTWAWFFASIAPGASIAITITVNVSANATILVNLAEVNYSTDVAGTVWRYDNATATTLVAGPLLQVTKSATAQANTGETIAYTITITNIGNADATNVVVTEFYPIGLTYALANPLPTIPNNIWIFPTIPALGSEMIQIWLTVDNNATSPLMNMALIEYENETGVSWPSEWVYANTTIIDPNIEMTKTAPAFANTGEQFTYTLTITNTGTDTAYNVVVTENYPAGVMFISAVPPPDIGNNVWQLGNIPVGGSVTITITVEVTTAVSGPLDNVAFTDYENGASTPRTMPTVWANATTIVRNPDMTITKWAPLQANSGETITYLVNYTNTGDDWAYNVVITETYPFGVTFVSAIPAPTSGNNVWDIGNVSPGGFGTIEITVYIEPWATGNLINFVVMDYENEAGINQTQESISAATMIVDPLMTITKEGPANATHGETITYWINYTNAGTDWAYNVVITETYPAGVTFDSAFPAPLVPFNNIWFIGDLAPLAGGTIMVNVSILGSAFGTITDWVYLDYDNEAARGMPRVNDSASTLIIFPTLTITKTAPAFANTGEQITYTITVTNTGSAPAENVVVTETYPVGIMFVSAVPPPDVGNNVWLIGTMGIGAVVTITITVNVTALSGTLTNLAEADYENSAGFAYPTVSDTATTQIRNPNMEIYKWAPPTANTGQIITYYLNYSNTGNDWAYNVVITETYPAGVIFIGAIPAPDIGNNVWIIPAVAPGGFGSIQINVQVNATGDLINFVEIRYNNSADISQLPVNATAITQVGDPEMNVIKYAPATAVAGDTIMYVIYYWNNGTSDAYNVIITETYPPNVTFLNANPPPDIGDNVWLIGTVPAGGSGVIFINVTINGNATGYLLNSVTLDFEDAAGRQSQVIAAEVTILTGPWIEVVKFGPAIANPGQTIMYVIQYSNTGVEDAHNVWINDTLPAGVTFVDSNPTPPDVIAPPLYGWFFLIIPANTTGYIFINVTIDANATGSIMNVVVVEYENVAGESLPINQAQVITQLNEPRLNITKQGPGSASPGETIVYWINYTNIGTDWAYDVIITETYPADVTFNSALPVPDIGNNVWLIGDLAPGASASIMIIVTIDVTATAPQVNFVEVTYNNSAGIAMPPVNDTLTTVVANPLLTVTKWAPAQANPGETITYWINITNSGEWAYNIVVIETYPAGVTWQSALPPPDVGNNIWFISSLAPGATYLIMITVTINMNAVGILNNTVDVDYDNAVSIPMQHINASAQTQVVVPNIVITKIAPATAATGDTIIYTVTVTNTGNGTAENVVLTENYPVGVTFVSAVPPADVGNNVWFIGTLAPLASFVVTITVYIEYTAFGNLTNIVIVDYTDANGGQYPAAQAQAVTRVEDPYFVITKDAPAYANPGQIITYWINGTNIGAGDAYNVVVTETYPADVTFISAIPAPDFGNNVWNIGTMAAGSSGSIQITVQIDLTASGNLRNWAFVDYENSAERQFPQLSTYADTIIIEPEMTITKTAPATANTGETITYWINYSNIGTDWAYNVTITENYPAGVTYASAIPVPTSGNNVWYIGNVAPNATESIQITVTVNPTAAGTLTNWIYLDYNSSAPRVMPQESDSASTLIVDPYIQIYKNAPATANPGETITYQIIVDNTMGTAPAYNVYVYETYPPGITFNSAVPAPIIPTDNVWLFPVIGAGATQVIDITVTVGMGAVGTLVNYVEVNYTDEAGEFQPEDQAWAFTNITGPWMTITKEATPFANNTAPNNIITYWINYSNIGNDWAYNVVITETYPAGITFLNALPPADVGNNVWLIGDVAPGGSGTIRITVQVNIGIIGILTNRADLDYQSEAGIQYPTVWDTAITVIGDYPYVEITKTAPAYANAGETITYKIMVENVGNVTAYDVVVTENYPFGVMFIGALPPPDIGNNVWQLGNMLAGDIIWINVTVLVTGTVYGTITDTVYMDCNNSGGTPMPTRWATANTYVWDANMEISKTGPAMATFPGQITYTITYFNSGEDTAYNVIITETYDPGVTFNSAVPPPDIGNNVWLIGDVPAGTGGSILVTVDINAAGIMVNNTVELIWNNSINVTFGPIFDYADTYVDWPSGVVMVTKYANATVNPGGVVQYIINYSNPSPFPANNVWIYDSIPPGTAYLSAFPVEDSVVGTTYGWDIGVLAPGASGTILLNVTVGMGASGILTNWVWANWTGGSESAYAETLVVNPYMEITKTAPAFALSPTLNFAYTISYTNTGTDTAYNVNITDVFDVDVTYQTAVPAPTYGDFVGSPQVIWIIASVPAGGSGSFTVYVDINALLPLGDVLTNWVFLNYSNQANDVQSDLDWANTTITDCVMTLSKTAVPLNANPGDTVMYTITYENLGPQAAIDVQIEEFYHADVTYSAAVPAPDIGNNIWVLGVVPASTVATITVWVTINAGANGILENRAQMNYTSVLDPNTYFLNATAITIVNEPYMTVTKDAPPTASPGQTIQYTITYQNIGSGLAHNVTIVENYPAGVTFLSAYPSPNSGDNVWNLGTLAPGAFGIIIINVTVSQFAFDTLTNWVYLTYQNASGVPTTIWDDARTNVGGPSMTISKTGPALANTGQQITYTISYFNAGIGVARNVIIQDPIPAGLNYVTSSPLGVNIFGVITWALGNVPGRTGGTITITFNVTAAAVTVLENWVFLNYTDLSGNQMPTRSAFARTRVVAPDVQVTKWAPATANSGETISYWINYTNTGTDWAYNVQIVETYDANVVYVGAFPAPDIPTNNVWTIGSIAPGASGSIQVFVTIGESFGPLPNTINGDIIQNDVDLTFENQIGVSALVQASAQTTVEDPVITVDKTAPPFANTGEYITYTITIDNTGDAYAYNVIVTENYPADVTFIGATIPPTVGNNIWVIPFIPNGASVVITITVMVNTNVPQLTILQNTVAVDYQDEIQIDQLQVSDMEQTQVIDPVLTIEKFGPGSANTGQNITYVIYVNNTGTDAAYNVVLDELYPADVIFVNSSDQLNTLDNITWTIGVIPATGTYILWINVTVADTALGQITNWVYVNYDDSVGEAQPEEYDDAVTQITDPAVIISKTTLNRTAVAGGNVFYNITYQNWGTGNATNVNITEFYPAGVTYVAATPIPTFGNNVWIIPNLAPGESGVISIWVTVNLNASIGDRLNNTVNLTYYDINGRMQPPESAYATTRIIGPVMTLVKLGPANATFGDIFNYTITLNNTGNDWAYNVVIRDIYPVGVTIITVNPQPTNSYIGYDEWIITALGPGASISLIIMVQASQGGLQNNTADLSYENAAGIMLPNLTAYVETLIFGGADNPPEIWTTPPAYVWADQNVTIWANVIDNETGVDTVIIYYTDIHGVQYFDVMIPNPGNYNTTTGNGWYNWTIPAQDFKGIITYYVWANDTNGNANRTGLYDVPVRLPPFFVWGIIFDTDDFSVNGALVLVTDTDTNETVIAVADGTGNYMVDLATLYSGYMDGEGVEVFATDGLYYGYNYSAVDLASYVDPGLTWPNVRVDVVLNEIPEFSLILTPIISILLLVVILRRISKKRSYERWEEEESR